MNHLLKIESKVTFAQLVGFENYRQWLDPLTPLLRSGDPLAPRGVLLAGMPGTGKASCVLATAKLIGRPVLRYHPDAGQASAIISERPDEPVILWLDEPDADCIELLRQLNLTRKSDKLLVMATTTRPQSLPASLVHSPCFDRIWHLDLPNVSGRAFLWDCLIKRVGGDPGRYDNVRFAQVSALFTPAEIESVARQAHSGNKKPGEKEILAHIARKTPCAASTDEQLARLRFWTRTYAEAI